jgi:DinB superfamily
MATTTTASQTLSPAIVAPTSRRANALAERLEQGAHALAALARTLTDPQWETRIPKDGRTFGVVVHHVASMYPIEIQLAQALAAGSAIAGVSWDTVHEINAAHAKENAEVTRQAALDLLERNSADAAAAIRALSDEQLDRAATVSLNADAPLTCQFFLEDHAVRHSYHHLAKIRAALAVSGV